MLIAIGIALLVFGAGLIAAGHPRRDEAMRPLIARSIFLQAVYPAVCLAFLVFGAAVLVSST